MKIEISVPSKTFILGEYAVLDEGMGLLATTQPTFSYLGSLDQSLSGESHSVFHEESPAGRLWKDQNLGSFVTSFEKKDPYETQGGFGGSTADYWAAQILSEIKTRGNLPKPNLFKVRSEYRQRSQADPSGADLLAQYAGALAVVDIGGQNVDSLKWRFQNYSFALFKTPHKKATHEHLKDLSTRSYGPFKEWTRLGVQAVKESDVDRFGTVVRNYEEALRQEGLRIPEVVAAIDGLNQKDLWAAKGCGALGADVIFVFFPKDDVEKVKSTAQEFGLQWVADETQMSGGLNWRQIH